MRTFPRPNLTLRPNLRSLLGRTFFGDKPVLIVKPGQTIAFTYARRTKSGHAGRIGKVESVNGDANTVTIRESVNGREQYRQFNVNAMMGVVVGS